MYLQFAEFQALSRTPMYMTDWIVKLDDFLKISDREILTHTGTVSHEKAFSKAHEEYEKYRHAMLDEPLRVSMSRNHPDHYQKRKRNCEGYSYQQDGFSPVTLQSPRKNPVSENRKRAAY